MNQYNYNEATEEEMELVYTLMDEFFVGDRASINVELWDDGDCHIHAFTTLGTGYHERYPDDVKYHRQEIDFERYRDHCKLRNVVVFEGAEPRKTQLLNSQKIDTENFK